MSEPVRINLALRGGGARWCQGEGTGASAELANLRFGIGAVDDPVPSAWIDAVSPTERGPAEVVRASPA